MNLPFLSLRHALIVLRVTTPLFFMAHAVARIAKGSIPQFAAFLGNLGFPQPTLLVWAITLFELIGGALIILGYKVRYLAVGLFGIAGVGILLIHRHLGWWVGEHGTGGSEYSVALMIALVVIAAADGEG